MITAVAEPAKVVSGTSTSSPTLIPKAMSPSARAKVPFGANTPWRAPIAAFNSAPKASVAGPSVSHPLAITSATASRSASPSHGFT